MTSIAIYDGPISALPDPIMVDILKIAGYWPDDHIDLTGAPKFIGSDVCRAWRNLMHDPKLMADLVISRHGLVSNVCMHDHQ